MKRFFYLLLCGILALMVQGTAMAASNNIQIESANIQKSDEGYSLSFKAAYELTRAPEQAVMNGVPIYFTMEVKMSRPRWYWFDENAVDTKQTVRIAYNVLTRQFVGAIGDGIQRNFATLDDALSLVRTPAHWVIAKKDDLSAGKTYTVSVRVRLDVSQLSKPFQIDAINNRDWQLSSGWTRFSYKVE